MIKRGVDLTGIQPQMAIAFAIAQDIFARYTYACWITSGVEGVHGPNSLHGAGRALDLRTKHVDGETVTTIHQDLKFALGEQFDVVLEKDHIHVEFDPKTQAGATEI